MSVSDLYKKHGNEEKSIKYLKQAAHCGYVGAVSKYLAYLLKQEPYDLAEIEAMELHTVNKQLNSIFILADFYYTHQDLCPGKIDWLLDVIRHSDNIYAADVLKKYEKRD